MSRKILIISSTPRDKGNSEVLCQEFARGARESGNSVVHTVLRNKTIQSCKGCLVCLKHGKCLFQDDMNSIQKDFLTADVIVMATPVYFYSISAQLKAVIDRTVPIYSQMKKKEFYFILTATDGNKANMNTAVACIRGFTDGCLENSVERGILYGTGLQNIGAAEKSKFMIEAFQMGKEV